MKISIIHNNRKLGDVNKRKHIFKLCNDSSNSDKLNINNTK